MDGKKLEYKGEAALKEIERLTSEADIVQQNLLQEILGQNQRTEYLSRFSRGSAMDTCEFKNSVPVITYKAIQPYIRRIAHGEDSSLITGKPITEMLCSSGTSAGEPKMMPSIEEDIDRRTFLYNLIMPIMNRYLAGLDEGKAMYLCFVKAERSTPCGLPARTVLTSYYKSNHFKHRAADAYHDFTSPYAAILCDDGDQSMYCQLLSGLVHRCQVLRLGAVFASAFLRAVSFLERNWGRMCDHIAAGHLDPFITDPECRSSMSSMLPSPNPTLAAEIREICSCPTWKGILCRLWPRAKYIEAVVTGSMAQYIPALKYYSEGKLPLVCTMYASSECYFGVNLRPLCDPHDVVFTLLPNMGYFEFIPLGGNGTLVMDIDEDEEVSGRKLVDLVNVRVGCYYELVVTTFAGLYRYRIGDVLQVTGFHNRAPQFRFICRRNVVLSIDNDKTNEEDLHKSITAAKKLLEPHDALLVEYTSRVDPSSVPGHYVLYWEIKHHRRSPSSASSDDSAANKPSLDHRVLEECCIVVEEELDYVYRRCRSNDRSVGPLEIRVVSPGTFELLMDFFISQGGSINQYKTPRCIKSSAALELLDGKVEASFFSPRDPTWRP
ncbi:putative indole-3-acetic acid-amido synthetase GH3.9 [Rhodamnia argentea]|uniref:Indole-3-acetic acid-amido synthetase GH3.9 n=1 Tax=Rhodamnia argentea TaxID=178133 RepID=A0A8B8PEZ5_9MYRT|nr:putative indole-3-acetic acid-amido synthetase GH3.9 [Rhodamnia argentea]